jgi:carbon-monoxide dehydrogenase large subunit
MGEFAIGQGVSRFEDPRLVRGGGRYIRTTSSCRAWSTASCCDHPTRTQKSDRSTSPRQKTAPGVLAVLTSADINTAGYGDLPVPGGLKRRDGSPMYRPRYPILAEDRVRWVGDSVAFVVAETVAQALDAAEMISVGYEELPAVTSTAEAPKPGAPRVWDDCRDNICFVELIGDKAAVDAAFRTRRACDPASLCDQPRHRSDNGTARCVGDYNAADGRYTIYTPIQRPHPTAPTSRRYSRCRKARCALSPAIRAAVSA